MSLVFHLISCFILRFFFLGFQSKPLFQQKASYIPQGSSSANTMYLYVLLMQSYLSGTFFVYTESMPSFPNSPSLVMCILG